MKSFFQFHNAEKKIPLVVFYDDGMEFVANHWHKEIEVAYCLEGSTGVGVNDVMYELNPGDIVFMAGGDSHFYLKSEHHRRMVIIFSMEMFENVLTFKELRPHLEDSLKSAARISVLWDASQSRNARQLLSDLCEAYESDSFGWELMVRAKLYEFTLLLATGVSRMPVSDNNRQNQIFLYLRSVFDYVEKNYKHEITLSDAADRLGYNQSYFARFFKKYMGTTFMEYLTVYRINKAQELLTHSDMNIADIGENVGFGSSKTFLRVFKAHVGCTPRQFRAKYLR